MPEPGTVRIAAVGDIHVTTGSRGALERLFVPLNAQADVLLLCGDLTDYGLKDEAAVLMQGVRGDARVNAPSHR
jgi:predicted phosphodiesterase